MTKSVIQTAIMTKILKINYFFKVNHTITPTSQRHHNKSGIEHSITLIIKSAFYTVGVVTKFVPEVSVCVNLAYVNKIQHKAAHFCTVVL